MNNNNKPKTISKKRLKKEKKTCIQIFRNKKFEPQFFIDPIACHRIYRDFLIPDIYYTTGSTLHHYQNYLIYKNLSQIHVRNLGVIFDLADKQIDYITPLGLLQCRLDSIGNKYAHELSEFLPFYYNFFEINSICEKKEELVFICNENTKINNFKRKSYK